MMRSALFVLLLWACSAVFAQSPAYFSELRGIDAGIGFTNLFYRIHSERNDSLFHAVNNDIYRWDLTANQQTLFLEDFDFDDQLHSGGQGIGDYEFIQSDPTAYIAGGFILVIDASPVIFLPGETVSIPWLGSIDNIEISRQNPDIVYASMNGALIKSADGGHTWDFDENNPVFKALMSVSPFDDQQLFVIDFMNNNALQKSLDGGNTFYTVSDTSIWAASSQQTRLFFAADSARIYAFSNLSAQKGLLISSTDAGESWQILREFPTRIKLGIDPFDAGTIFLATGSEILISDDHGQTFSPYWTFSRDIIDLYKKPFSDILYAATKFNIYKITPTDTVSIKSLPVVGIADEPPGVIREFALHQNYPNPFNPATTIAFDLPIATDVELSVFDAAGRQVVTLLRGRQTAGRHAVAFDGRNLASGVYFYRLKAANRAVLSRKMLLIK